MISLRVYAGWSEPLLVEHTTLLEISCTGSYVFGIKRYFLFLKQYTGHGSHMYLRISYFYLKLLEQTMRPWKGGPSIPYPFNYFEKISHIPKINMANISKIQKALYPHIPKIDPNIPYPNIYKNIPYPFKFLANIPVSLKLFPGPQL